MPHVRQQIREAVAARLTGLPTTGSHVFESRMRAQREADLPCLLVTTNGEKIDPADDFGALQQRTLSLVVVGTAKQTDSVDDTLDDIAAEVEAAMVDEPNASLVGIETDFDDQTDKPVGRIAIEYQIVYFTRTGIPGAHA